MLYTLFFSSQCYPHFLQPVLYTFSFSPASTIHIFIFSSQYYTHFHFLQPVLHTLFLQPVTNTEIQYPAVLRNRSSECNDKYSKCQDMSADFFFKAAAGCVLLETEQWHPPSFTRWSSKRAFSTRGVQRALARIWPVTMASFLRSSSLNPFWNTSTCNKVASSPHMNHKSASFREEIRAKNSHGSNNGP